MCGICGIVNGNRENPVPLKLLQAMCDTIRHRGPDDEGTFISGNVALGARRLSIIDVAGGHQPLSNEDGSVWVAYNGEVYNFHELKQELTAAGHKFATSTDTEVLAHGYEEWGEDLVQRLRGMYAFAVWDRKNDSVWLFRDRLGIKPLYYALMDNGTLVFGSELKAILKHPGVPRRLDHRALDMFLTLEYVPAPHSIFRDIRKLPAGCRLHYHLGRIRIDRYWALEPPDKIPFIASRYCLPALQEELYALLREAVKMRLISDVPLGAFLSGGIDSSCIVGLMHEAGAVPLKTFSIGFEDASYNELDHARRIAQRFSTKHEEFILKPQALELTEKLVSHLDEPFGDFSIFPTYMVSEMARRHVTVILSGDGGDEIFGGYDHYQAQKLARISRFCGLNQVLPAVVTKFPPADKKKGAWNKLRRFGQGLANESRLRHLRWMMFLSDREKAHLYSSDFIRRIEGIAPLDRHLPFRDLYRIMPEFDSVTAELYLDLNTYLVDNILVKVDRMSMATSLETRVPLLDHKVVEFIFRLPGRFKLHGLTTKWLFKKTMEPLLPRENIYRSKEGFSIPIKHWLKNELKPMLCDHLSHDRIERDGLFDPGAVQRMIDLHMAGRENFSHQLWALLVFSIWKDRYL